eukprot:scaffold2026_cov78-Cylindrotheca_fusiformis.AAC.5
MSALHRSHFQPTRSLRITWNASDVVGPSIGFARGTKVKRVAVGRNFRPELPIGTNAAAAFRRSHIARFWFWFGHQRQKPWNTSTINKVEFNLCSRDRRLQDAAPSPVAIVKIISFLRNAQGLTPISTGRLQVPSDMEKGREYPTFSGTFLLYFGEGHSDCKSFLHSEGFLVDPCPPPITPVRWHLSIYWAESSDLFYL